MKPRARLVFALSAGFGIGLVAAVLHGIPSLSVRATGQPPAVLDKLKLTQKRPLAPAVSFVDAAGKSVRLADFQGRYVLVNLWATWCWPCIAELPALARLNASLPQERVTVLPIDLEKLDAAKVGDFLKLYGVEALPIYIDRKLDAMRGFGVNELPLTVLIDSDGHELARAAGPQKWDDPASVAYLNAISAPTPAGPQHADASLRHQ
ncbi:MAG TPA: TlpA disulfide reductase family protein [Rhizomicrobium sp.]|nr:TlpA disulfide reductase family protein [Rhizomicrobium sp.]